MTIFLLNLKLRFRGTFRRSNKANLFENQAQVRHKLHLVTQMSTTV